MWQLQGRINNQILGVKEQEKQLHSQFLLTAKFNKRLALDVEHRCA